MPLPSNPKTQQTAIIIVDHGSRRAESNQLLEEVASLFGRRFAELYDVVEPAHMELCEPSIATAYARCAERGATTIVVCPFFLGPGKHWTKDIPTLTAEAAARFPRTRYHVTMPIGVDDLILDLLNKRVQHCVTNGYACDDCRGTIRSGDPGMIPAATNGTHHDGGTTSNNGQCSTCPFVVQLDGTIIDTRQAVDSE